MAENEREGNETEAASSQNEQPRRSDEVNERTRLLPRQDQGQGYLSPDDPAVNTQSPKIEHQVDIQIGFSV